LPSHINTQKEENRPMHCIQWSRKEVASIFSTFQSPNKMLSGMDELDTRFNVSDSSKSPLKSPIWRKSESLSLFSEHHHQQGGHTSCYQFQLITRAPCSYNKWVECSDLLSHLSCAPHHMHKRSGGFLLIGGFFLTQTQKQA